MVHALNEIQRVLAPDSILIDLRPLAGNWPIEVASAREIKEAGRATDLEIGLEDDRAANERLRRLKRKDDSSVNARNSFLSFIIGTRRTR